MAAAKSPAPHLEFAPPPSGGLGRSWLMALLIHCALIAALTWGVAWNRTESAVVQAEIWASVPVQAAPPALAPTPAPPAPPAPEPALQTARVQTPATEDAEIVLERRRKEALEKKRLEAERREAERQREEERRLEAERKKAAEVKAAEKKAADRKAAEKKAAEKKAEEKKAAEKLAADKQAAEEQAAIELERERERERERKRELERERERAEDAQREAARQENLRRIQGMAGATGGPQASGSARQSAGPSDSYGGRIVARVKPNIVYTDTMSGNPQAEVEVRAAPDGTIVGTRIVKPSGVKAWDEAVLKALDKTQVLPRDVDGRVPSPLILVFRPRD